MQKIGWLVIALFVVLTAPGLAQMQIPEEQSEQPMIVEPPDVSHQETQPLIEPAPIAVEIKPDRDIFRRAPSVDGQIEHGEWDVFYLVDTPNLKATTFANWTDNALYYAVQSDRAVDILILIDGKNDGWFHDNDNYRIMALRNEPKPTLQIERYNSHATRKPEPQPLSTHELAEAIMKTTADDSGYSVEMLVPTSLLDGCDTKADARIGLRFAIRSGSSDAAWIPQAVMGDVQDCVLVENKSAALEPLQVHLQVRDTRIARGEEVEGRLFLRNHGSEIIDANTFVIGGEGKAAPYLNSEMIRIEGLLPGKLIRHTFKSRIPSNMPLGHWALGAELRSGQNRFGGTLASFEIVEPYEVMLDVPRHLRAGRQRLAVTIRNNTRRPAFGRAVIQLPDGWQLIKSRDTRSFNIRHEDGVEVVNFDVDIPGNTSGGASISAEVTLNKETLVVSREVQIVDDL